MSAISLKTGITRLAGLLALITVGAAVLWALHDRSHLGQKLQHQAEAALVNNQADEAFALNAAAREQDPLNPQLYVQLGRIEMIRYEWDAAMAAFNRALALNPETAAAYYYRGQLYASRNRLDESIDDLERFLNLASTSPLAASATRSVEALKAQITALESQSPTP